MIDKLVTRRDSVTLEDLEYLLSTEKYDEIIFEKADEIREKYVGKEVHLRAIIEFSNICTKSCLYCGLRAENKKLKRYRMSPEEIIKRAELIAEKGIKTIVLQSGEDPYYTTEIIEYLIKEIKKFDVAITLSIGERKFEEYRIWKTAGADRYLMRHETACPELYNKLHPDDSFENRKKHLFELKKIGYETGAGSMVGLPGQGPRELAMDILFTRELDADMVGIGPFIPNPDTPLKNEKGGDLNTTLKVIALTRLLLPTANIPATTAMGSIHPFGRQKALKCGANVIMPNLTPNPYRPNYTLYPGKICLFEADTACVECVKGMIKGLSRNVGKSYGFRVKLTNV
ncbi:[FeFe] hydrogenase H-cluster radical SAM maturase HydE [Thermosipho ferrireducens]|uniref:[FeFe] hydrogenase H-cluster radical SAM maturase HydE n=1 Tax=Thermosipho ferrireducens TaxID=2571116 RepID=A0ABX7SBM3_9BACT|nr:[FeFe] hydrogenase H-cluster radical SAM maturase HydE [Thermosipho ferrireducens]QTA38956.1 [FeFe] hydrogenase H-cluster radical SAM maturase HydE [Thermosipho ferrireducens]